MLNDILRMPRISTLFGAGVLVVLFNLVFLGTIFVVDSAIDEHRLFDRVAGLADAGVITGQDYPPDLATYEDRFTDCVGISLDLPGSQKRSARELIRDMDVPRMEGRGACQSLLAMLHHSPAVQIADYARYWHGYQIFSKPLLYFGALRSLRYIFACLTLIALLAFSLSVFSVMLGTTGAAYAIWFAGGFMLLTDAANLGNVFTHAISLFFIFLLPTLILRCLRGSDRYRRHLFLMAVAAGCINSFFDLLFNPPLGLSALVIGCALGVLNEKASVRDLARLTIIVAFGWAIGFFGTYVCRFAIAAALSDDPRQTLENIYTAGLFRLSGMEEKIKPWVGWATIQNFGYPMLKPSFAVFAVGSAAIMAHLWRSNRTLALRPINLVFLIPTPISVIWFEIFRNHSQHHHWFTYRSASFCLVGMAAFVIVSLIPPRQAHGALSRA